MGNNNNVFHAPSKPFIVSASLNKFVPEKSSYSYEDVLKEQPDYILSQRCKELSTSAPKSAMQEFLDIMAR